jgi:hypothetical protein
MRVLFVLLFFILTSISSLKSQNYFQIGMSLGSGYNFNHMKEPNVSPFQTKNILGFSYYLDISYHFSKNLFIETNLGSTMVWTYIETVSSKISPDDLYSNNSNGQTVLNIPLYVNYNLFRTKNNWSLKGIIGINNLFPTESEAYIISTDSPTSTLFYKSKIKINSGYYFCLIGGLAFEKQYPRGNRLGLKIIYQQGFEEIAYQEVRYSFNSHLFDNTTKSYTNGSQLNLYLYYYWKPLGKKYRNINPSNKLTE